MVIFLCSPSIEISNDNFFKIIIVLKIFSTRKLFNLFLTGTTLVPELFLPLNAGRYNCCTSHKGGFHSSHSTQFFWFLSPSSLKAKFHEQMRVTDQTQTPILFDDFLIDCTS
ncbi:hypothetical protein AVEN_241054-1 [Araneus ventricosus]|uniref:Uncharacterized protein n=1 Tax=Araneus ventricosus TaxID=182803 RepID=A0A4Y2LBY9_ARAVE|nr:hypothetical protein AVEN_241054-1 [Araneus ventricosus]